MSGAQGLLFIPELPPAPLAAPREPAPVRLLRRTRAILTRDVDAWCQGAIAKTREGEHVSHESPVACTWCLIGAFRLACHLIHPHADVQRAAFEALDLATVIAGRGGRGDPPAHTVADWQDQPGRTLTEVVDAINAACDRLQDWGKE